MYKLFVTDDAQEDLEAIVEYITFQLGNPIAANNFLDDLEQCYHHLCAAPLMYAQSNNPRLCREGYRRALINHYLALFKVNEDAKTVTIHRFFYGARDYSKLL